MKQTRFADIDAIAPVLLARMDEPEEKQPQVPASAFYSGRQFRKYAKRSH